MSRAVEANPSPRRGFFRSIQIRKRMFRVWSQTAAGKAEAQESDLAHQRELSQSRSRIYELPLSFRIVEVIVDRIRIRLLFVFEQRLDERQVNSPLPFSNRRV